MEISWLGDRCIICLEQKSLTLEHVIPDALGGKLTCKFLCFNCNSTLGSKVDAKAKNDPTIRYAALSLQSFIPTLVTKIEEGQRYSIKTDVAVLKGVKRANEVNGTWTKMEDGSDIAPEDLAIKSLKGRMRSEGLSEESINDFIDQYLLAEPGETVALSSKLSAKKLAAYNAGPNFSGPNVDSLLFLKIAYEFSALLIGRAIYRPEFDTIRHALKSLQRDSNCWSVETLVAKKIAAFHGIAFEGNSPHATFQIRLFGRNAYRVKFKNLELQIELSSYTHDLESGEHWLT